jgi:hypothetical protein
VYDALGRLVRTLLDSGTQSMQAGEHRLVWGGAGVAAGVYLVRLETESGATGGKVIRSR